MLWMAQRIFYGQQSSLVSERPHLDLGAREQLALWPMAILMVVMGLFSPYWMKAIDPAMSGLANPPAAQVIAPGAATSASAPSPQGGAR